MPTEPYYTLTARKLTSAFMFVLCRKSELTGLKREAYNAFTNTIYVPKSKAGYPQEKDGFRSLGDFRKAAGLQNVRVHDLWQVAASDLCAYGNSERTIMDIDGRKTPMLSTYWHKDRLRSAQNIQFSRKCGASGR